MRYLISLLIWISLSGFVVPEMPRISANPETLFIIDSTASTIMDTINDSIISAESKAGRESVEDTSEKESTEKTSDDLPAKPAEVIESISFSKILWTVVFLIFGYLFTKMLVKVMSLIAEKSPRARITIKSLIPVVRIIIWVILISAIIKGIFNPPIETIITVGASIGIALGLAAQDLLKNVFGGLALLFDRPFQVGDKIEAGDHYGEVIEIGLRTTRMVTGDDSVIILPNAELINVSVLNSNYGKIYCQVTADIFLPINIDVEKVRKIAEEAARVSRYVYLQMPVVVLFKNEINEQRSYLKMELKAYVMDIRYELKFKSDMTEIVIRELLKAGIISKDDLF